MIAALLAAAVLTQTEPPPPAASEPLIPAEFLDQALTWDAANNRAVKGRQKTVLTRNEFFTEVGRVDLIARSESLASRRVLLFGSAAGLVAAGIAGGVALLATSPDMNSAKCVANITNFTLCHNDNRVHQTGGIGLMSATIATAMLLATLGWWSNPEVLDSDEAISLTSKYNAGLMKRLRGQTVSWMPAVSPNGAHLALAGKF